MKKSQKATQEFADFALKEFKKSFTPAQWTEHETRLEEICKQINADALAVFETTQEKDGVR